MSETASQASWDDFSDSRCPSPSLSVTFDDSAWDDDHDPPQTSSFVLEPLPPPPPLTSPPTFTSSIWTRFGSSLSRLTRVPSAEDKQAMSPRDDVVDGAESDNKSDLNESANASQSVDSAVDMATKSSGRNDRDSRSKTPVASEDDSEVSKATDLLSQVSLDSDTDGATPTATSRSPSRSPLRRTVSEASIQLSTVARSAPDPNARVTAKPPLPKHRRSPSATVSTSTGNSVYGSGKKSVEDKRVFAAVPPSPVSLSSPSQSGDVSTVNDTGVSHKNESRLWNGMKTNDKRAAGKPQKSLRLASEGEEIFV